MVGYGEDDVHRLGLRHFRRRKPGAHPVRVFDPEWRASAGIGDDERAGLAVMEPLKGKPVAVRIDRAVRAEGDALATLRLDAV